MGNFEKFLSSLTDHELAVFARYRQNDFLKDSKEKIAYEIEKRNLSVETLENYFKMNLTSTTDSARNVCPRCGSDRLFVESDFTEMPFNEFSSVEIAVETNRCMLCGFNPAKTEKNVFQKVKNIFTKTRHKRISGWNSF